MQTHFVRSRVVPRTLAVLAGVLLCASWVAADAGPDAATVMPMLERLGLPVVMLLALAWAVWKSAQWIARTFQPHLERMFDAHHQLVKTCEGAVESMKDNEARQTVAIEAQAEVMRGLGIKVDQIAQRGCAHPNCYLRPHPMPQEGR